MKNELSTSSFEFSEVSSSRDNRESITFCLYHDNNDNKNW